MSGRHYVDGVLRALWDDTGDGTANRPPRTYYEYDAQGVQILSRPYSAAENAALDAILPDQQAAQFDATRRVEADALVAAQLQLIEEAHTDGEPWVQPTGAHDAYKLGAEVQKDGKTWVSLTPFNVWAPGVSGWREKVTGGGYPAWVQPTGGHDAYGLGARVAHKGSNWESTVAANVWEPGVFGWNVI